MEEWKNGGNGRMEEQKYIVEHRTSHIEHQKNVSKTI